MNVKIERIDHVVLTVADVEATCAFYARVLGMQPLTWGDGRRALQFGRHTFNLHAQVREFEPKALRPTAGSGDICSAARQRQEALRDLETGQAEIQELGSARLVPDRRVSER